MSAERRAYQEASTVLNGQSPLAYEGAAKLHPGGHSVFFARYNPNGFFPRNLGKLPDQADLAGIPSTPGSWTEEPQPGSRVVIKIGSEASYGPGGLDKERGVMGRTNTIFDEKDLTRPVRLYGYGIFDIGNGPYLATEYVPFSHHALRSNLEHSPLPLEETLTLGVEVAQLVARLHRLGIAHKDLEGIEAQEHIFWDPESKSVRMIDWNLSQVSRLRNHRLPRAAYEMDKNAIAKILTRALVGDKYLKRDMATTMEEHYNGPFKEELVRIIDRGQGLEDVRYPHNPAGTEEFANDLRAVLAAVRGEEQIS